MSASPHRPPPVLFSLPALPFALPALVGAQAGTPDDAAGTTGIDPDGDVLGHSGEVEDGTDPTSTDTASGPTG